MANLICFRRLLSKPITVSRILISRSMFTTTTPFPRKRLLSLPATSHFFSLHYHKLSIDVLPGGRWHAEWVQLRKELFEDRMSEGIDSGHYLVEMYKPDGDLSRDELINHYVHTLACVLGSEEEAKKKIYSVSTRHHYAFSAHLRVGTAWKLFDLPGVQFVRPDDIKGEPFVDGKAFPYDPQYHEDYIKSLQEEEEEDYPPGCDFNHWVVVMSKRKYKDLSRDEIINSYIKTLADHIFEGSEGKARKVIYSVSTRFHFAFSVHLGVEYEAALNDLPDVDYVLPDSYIDVENKTYRGEPFINGKAVPYDPKYHKEFC